jgi:ATP-dependent RNA helicase RhlE
VEALEHVVNFDVPHVPEDYIHRVGRTARAEATGDAYTFVSPDEEADLRAIERAVGKKLPRVTVADFDYNHKPADRFEVPLAERIAEIRARKSEERARAKAKAERKAQNEAAGGSSRGPRRPAEPSRDRPRAEGRPSDGGRPRNDRGGQHPRSADGRGQGGGRSGGRSRSGGRPTEGAA